MEKIEDGKLQRSEQELKINTIIIDNKTKTLYFVADTSYIDIIDIGRYAFIRMSIPFMYGLMLILSTLINN